MLMRTEAERKAAKVPVTTVKATQNKKMRTSSRVKTNTKITLRMTDMLMAPSVTTAADKESSRANAMLLDSFHTTFAKSLSNTLAL